MRDKEHKEIYGISSMSRYLIDNSIIINLKEYLFLSCPQLGIYSQHHADELKVISADDPWGHFNHLDR